MFFILSGYVLKAEHISLCEYVRVKFNRILLPAIIIYSLTLPLYFHGIDFRTESLTSIFRTILYFDGKCAYNAPIWFFFCLFEVYVLIKIFKLAEASNVKLMVVMVISLLCSFICYDWELELSNTFGFNKCLLGLFFVCFGIMLKRSQFDVIQLKLIIASIPVWLITGVWMNGQVSMYGVNYCNFLLFIISAITGSVCFFAFCKLIEKHDFIRQYSQWTIFIVCSHYVLVTVFKGMSNKMAFEGTYMYDVLSVVFVVVSLIIYKPVCIFVERYIPILMGKKELCRR